MSEQIVLNVVLQRSERCSDLIRLNVRIVDLSGGSRID